MNSTTRKRWRVRAKKVFGPDGTLISGVPTPGEVITSEDGRSFTVLSAEPDGDRHMILILEAPARA